MVLVAVIGGAQCGPNSFRVFINTRQKIDGSALTITTQRERRFDDGISAFEAMQEEVTEFILNLKCRMVAYTARGYRVEIPPDLPILNISLPCAMHLRSCSEMVRSRENCLIAQRKLNQNLSNFITVCLLLVLHTKICVLNFVQPTRHASST